VNETKSSGDHSRARQKRALSVAGVLIILAGAVAGAILMPQEMARRAAQPKEASHTSPFRRRPAAAAVSRTPFMRGVCWEGAGRIDSTDLDPLARVNANWISQTPFGWQRHLHDPEVRAAYGRPHRWGGYWGESDEGIAATTRWAHARGIKVLLKPHIWTRREWSGSISMRSDADWAKWFASYRAFIVYYADLARRIGADALAVGTELGGTTKREREWRAIIAEVRRHYPGPLVYCANWAEDLHQTRFWDALDWIGVQAYYPLTKKPSPSTEELVQAWAGPLADLDTMGKIWNKPVVLTEIGYRSTDNAADRPWEWAREGTLSVETQARCYESLFRALPDHPVVHGVFIWKWHPDYAQAGGPEDDQYSPQRKPAEQILARGYAQIERRGL
jgi:glycosyl hydrolase family 113